MSFNTKVKFESNRLSLRMLQVLVFSAACKLRKFPYSSITPTYLRGRCSNHQPMMPIFSGPWKFQPSFLSVAVQGRSHTYVFFRGRNHHDRIPRAPPDDTFPNKVQYESYCGEQCRHFSDRWRIDFHVNVVALLNSLVQTKGGVKQAVQADILCALPEFHLGHLCLYFPINQY